MRKISKLGVGVALLAATGSLVFVAPASAGSKGEYATLTVTKTVVGTAPAGTEFTIEVECTPPGDTDDTSVDAAAIEIPPFSVVLTFGATGGTEDVLIGSVSNCLVIETDDGGATSSSDPILIGIQDPVQYDAEIVNTFAEVSPTSAVAPTTAAVAPAVATPRFTG